MSLAQGDNPVGIAQRKLGLVQTAKHRDLSFAGDVTQDIEHIRRRDRIEARDRLVGENEPTLLRQHAGDGDALLLAAGQRIRALISVTSRPTRSSAASAI